MDIDFVKHKFKDGHIGVLTRSKFQLGIRHVQILYMLLCTLVLGVLRGSNGISMLALSDQTRLNDTYIQIHDWNRRIQGIALSSFFLGYTLALIPAEVFLKKLNGKLILTAVLLTNGAIYVALPTIVNKGGWIALCNAQFILGMSQTCLYPAFQTLFSEWVPPYERNFLSTIVYGGIHLGIIIAFPLVSIIMSSPLGWELIFYSSAMMALPAAVIWLILTAPSPERHPAISDKEKDFIYEALEYYKQKNLQKPWRQVLTSPAFWAITFAHVSSNAVFVFFITEVPAYLVLGLRIPLQKAVWYAMFPFVFMLLTYITVLPTTNCLYRIGYINYFISQTLFRKIINTLGAIGIVIGLCVLSYLEPEWSTLSVAILCGILSIVGFQYAGFLENCMDISENFSGTLIMLTSVPANLVGAVVPFISGLIVSHDVTDLSRWRVVFLTLASLCTICNMIYLVLGSGERQFWDNVEKRTNYSYYNDVNQLELEDLKDQEKVIPDQNANNMI